MEQKRKTQPINLKRYWVGFSLLALFLLIPFRIINMWLLTNIIYTLISMHIMLAIIEITRRIGWKNRITILMLVCLMLPIYQIKITMDFKTEDNYTPYCYPLVRGIHFTEESVTENKTYMVVLEPFQCTKTIYGCGNEYLAIRYTPIMLQLSVNPYQFCG